jgi:phage baseplate assembly protein W
MKKLDTPQIASPFDILSDGSVREVEQDSVEEIAMAVELILRWPIGFREELTEFGVPELAFRDRQDVPSLIRQYVERWEPRVDLLIEARPAIWDQMVQEYVLRVGSGADV